MGGCASTPPELGDDGAGRLFVFAVAVAASFRRARFGVAIQLVGFCAVRGYVLPPSCALRSWADKDVTC
jgi:hypothetical protein